MIEPITGSSFHVHEIVQLAKPYLNFKPDELGAIVSINANNVSILFMDGHIYSVDPSYIKKNGCL